MTLNADNWDQHWTEFPSTSTIAAGVLWRRRVIEKLLGVSPPGGGARVLEIGCGTGSFAELFVAKYPEAAFLGLDSSAIGVREARRKVPTAVFRQRDLLLPQSREDDLEFGATHAVCSEVCEHVDDPAALLRNSMDYMAPGCRLVVTVPGGPISEYYKYLGHRRHYNAASLRELLQRAGYEVEFTSGIGFPFFNIYIGALVLRGKGAIEQLSGEPSRTTRLVSKIFDRLFYLNSMHSGWQIVGVGRKPQH
jgi:SAM-dependent methyltransferase